MALARLSFVQGSLLADSLLNTYVSRRKLSSTQAQPKILNATEEAVESISKFTEPHTGPQGGSGYYCRGHNACSRGKSLKQVVSAEPPLLYITSCVSDTACVPSIALLDNHVSGDSILSYFILRYYKRIASLDKH